ncbi:hypothetical protein D6827_02915 [Candidatus Parcubacteria bacterium]|nr:MAG: hypothetical protein D6827_02915 [Candidatus Parcubacteria bacterium]
MNKYVISFVGGVHPLKLEVRAANVVDALDVACHCVNFKPSYIIVEGGAKYPENNSEEKPLVSSFDAL